MMTVLIMNGNSPILQTRAQIEMKELHFNMPMKRFSKIPTRTARNGEKETQDSVGKPDTENNLFVCIGIMYGTAWQCLVL